MTRQVPFKRIMERLERCETRDGLADVAADLREGLKVDHVVYHWPGRSGQQAFYGTYGRKWTEYYVANGIERSDPILIGCYQSFHPVDWKALDWSTKSARTFFKDAIDRGVGNQGLSVPLRGPNGQFAVFSVSHSCDDDAWSHFQQAHKRDLIVIAHHFNQKALEFEPEADPKQFQSLSPREVDVISLLAEGRNRSQISDSLSISEHTVRVYIESARLKLGANNVTHAVARALSRGLVWV